MSITVRSENYHTASQNAEVVALDSVTPGHLIWLAKELHIPAIAALHARLRYARDEAATWLELSQTPPEGDEYAYHMYGLASKYINSLESAIKQQAALEKRSKANPRKPVQPLPVDAARAADIRIVLRRRGIQQRPGDRFDCPFCDGGSKGTGQVGRNNRYFCHRCGASHDAISLIQSLDRLDFSEAVRLAAAS